MDRVGVMDLLSKLLRAIRVPLRHIIRALENQAKQSWHSLAHPPYYTTKRNDLTRFEADDLTSLANSLDSRWLVHFSSSGNELVEAFATYGSAKQGTAHGSPYSNLYHELFASSRNVIGAVFECGIGTTNAMYPYNMGPAGIPGASLRAWAEFFPNAQIYGADIDTDVLFKENRIQTYQMDQTNPSSIASVWAQLPVPEVDVIIDDGSHEFESNVTFLENSIQFLKRKTGIFIIEDVHHSYLKELYDYISKPNLEIKTYSLLGPHRQQLLSSRSAERLGANSVVTIRKK